MQIWSHCHQSQLRSKKSKVAFIWQRDETNAGNLNWSCAGQNGCFSPVFPKLEAERRAMHCSKLASVDERLFGMSTLLN